MMQTSSLDNSRIRYLLTYALCLATAALKTEENPPWDDIKDMEKLLDFEPQFVALFRQIDVIRAARKLGWALPAGPLTEEIIQEAREWIEWHSNVVQLFPKKPKSP